MTERSFRINTTYKFFMSRFFIEEHGLNSYNPTVCKANAFQSQYRENAPRRRISLSNRLKLVLKHL